MRTSCSGLACGNGVQEGRHIFLEGNKFCMCHDLTPLVNATRRERKLDLLYGKKCSNLENTLFSNALFAKQRK
jgi:hypothetical protein